MPTFLRRRPIIGLVFIIGIPILTIYVISFLCAKSGFFYGMGIPIQDCEMTKTILQGTVIDTHGEPIPNTEIYFANTPVDNSTPVKHQILTNQFGNFGPEPIRFFKCEPINFTFTAIGFRSKSTSYILDYGLLNSLPNELTITLERSSQ